MMLSAHGCIKLEETNKKEWEWGILKIGSKKFGIFIYSISISTNFLVGLQTYAHKGKGKGLISRLDLSHSPLSPPSPCLFVSRL